MYEPIPEECHQGRGDSQAVIVSAITKFGQGTAFESLGTCRDRHRAALESLLRTVEWKLIEMPLPRAQIVGDREDRFIYEIGWTRVCSAIRGRFSERSDRAAQG
jgi:hypothetical protein